MTAKIKNKFTTHTLSVKSVIKITFLTLKV